MLYIFYYRTHVVNKSLVDKLYTQDCLFCVNTCVLLIFFRKGIYYIIIFKFVLMHTAPLTITYFMYPKHLINVIVRK